MRRLAPLLVLAIGATTPGCFTLDLDGDGDIDIPPAGGYESDYISCSNGRDDDLDGRIDCQDSDCLMGGHCGEQIPILEPVGYENTFDTCSNGIDDDLDGQFDCGDRGCQNIFELCCLLEFDDASCSNLLDDDGNGFADCADFSCRNNPYVTVCDTESICDDEIDNDGDRLTDCRDPDCSESEACAETGERCANMIDDDLDELTDCEDPSCFGTTQCPPESSCTDDVDDNGDGRTDCADASCYMDPACLGEENTLEFCQDGNDNDGNGFTDCGDFGCSRSMDMAILDYCASISETTLARCMDGVDNDGNGFTDCDDFSCSRAMDAEITGYCASIGENTLERCMDGLDNDDNGFIDCADFGCSRADDLEVAAYCRTQGEATIPACTDGRDNDQNGFVDCADFSCRFTIINYGSRFCEADEDCPGSLRCGSRIGGSPLVGAADQFCDIEGCPSRMDSDCAPGYGCEQVELSGGTIDLCFDVCDTDADCAPGASCYRPVNPGGRRVCLALRSPCFETTSIDEDSEIQGNDGTFATDTTLEERQRQVFRSCTDGVDGDQDGFTDCQDWECNHNPLAVNPATGEPVCRYARGNTCVLGPNAGQPCSSDDDCGAISGACGPPGPEGRELVCP